MHFPLFNFMNDQLDILYRDEFLVAINKPSGLLVHRSAIDRHETRFAMQILRDQIGQHVFPVHRLDKPTSGVLIFALSAEAATKMGAIFAAHQAQKIYLAIVRGVAPESILVNHPLTEEVDKYTDAKASPKLPQEAITQFYRLAEIELPYSVDKYPQSRYSLVKCLPQTGRKHQIRRHLKHISHPIIGDAKHGKGNHNRFFQHQFNAHRLLLAATELTFTHPFTQQAIKITAPLDTCMLQLVEKFGWLNVLNNSHTLLDIDYAH